MFQSGRKLFSLLNWNLEGHPRFKGGWSLQVELGLRWGQEGLGPFLPEDSEPGHEAVREGVFVGAQGALTLNLGL